MKKRDLWELLKQREEAKKPKPKEEVKKPEGDQNGSTDDNTADNNG